MSKSRPKLSDLRRVCPQDLAHCEGYVWHLGTKIGKGSFGEVYLGWTNDGNAEVAVKVVRKEFFKQDPKVRENLEREIRILKLLRGCEYVVQILHVQELRHSIVLVMELCDYDLDHLVKTKPFKEETVIVFLYQLAQGMKALRNQNIVHRDLKPGNILIMYHPTTKKMMIKLADFGFARHFKDEGNKAIDMTSLAGTPVFMAPEALSCVFHPGEHYDDKVDIWSIGALLYKIIVGQCGFYAQLQDIPRILKHKGDAIAFERGHNRKVNYICELPSSVNDRLSESFRYQMKNLLCSMLKLDPRERMTFTEFFETVDDIIRSKIEVINLLHGTSFKIISDPSLTADVLVDKVHIQWHVPSVSQIIFSTSCSHYISPYENLSQTQLVELLDKSGGTEGHAKLYLLPLNQLQQAEVAPDSTCFTALRYTVEDQVSIINLITEQKFSDEIVHMIGYMGAQQKKQLEGLEELALFTAREMGMFKANIYPSLLEQVHQTLAQTSLALNWLNEDVANFDGLSNQAQFTSLVSSLDHHKSQLQQHLQELMGFDTDCPKLTNPHSKDEISKNIAMLSDSAKKLPKARKDQIQMLCNNICKDSIAEISRVTQIVKIQLSPFIDVLTRVWSLRKKSTGIFELCSTINGLLVQASQERSVIFKSLQSGAFVQDKKSQAAPVNHLPVVTPPPAWPHPAVGGSYLPPASQPWADPTVIDNLKRQIEQLNSQLASATEENIRLNTEATSLRSGSENAHDVESTLIPGQLSNTSSSDIVEQTGIMEDLRQKLKQFCVLAERMNLGGPSKERPAQAGTGAGAALYPLLADYSVISMPSSEDYDVQKMLPVAVQLSTSLSSNMTSLQTMAHKSYQGVPTLTTDSALVKIGRPSEYDKGDVVLFTAVKTVKSKSTIPALFHLQQFKPYVLLDPASFGSFNIRPGKTPEIFFGKLLDAPRKVKFEEHRDTASDIGEESGEFYFVTAERVSLKFSAQRAGFAQGTLDQPPSRPARSPTVPSPSGGGGQKRWKPFNRSHGHKPEKDFV